MAVQRLANQETAVPHTDPYASVCPSCHSTVLHVHPGDRGGCLSFSYHLASSKPVKKKREGTEGMCQLSGKVFCTAPDSWPDGQALQQGMLGSGAFYFGMPCAHVVGFCQGTRGTKDIVATCHSWNVLKQAVARQTGYLGRASLGRRGKAVILKLSLEGLIIK